jgi:hypothetical protein
MVKLLILIGQPDSKQGFFADLVLQLGSGICI